MRIDKCTHLCYNKYSGRDKGNFHSGGKKKGSEVMNKMPTATELAIKYAKREQLRIIIDKAHNIHADCDEYGALSKLIEELKQMLEEA